MNDCLIIGGGVIGLSLAYELSGRGLDVCLIDRDRPGCEASWAGAGILTPHRLQADDPGEEQLAGLSCQLHPQWAADLREETGIDNGYRPSGAIYVARDRLSAEMLSRKLAAWQARDLSYERLEPETWSGIEPALCLPPNSGETEKPSAFLLPGEGQIRNPRHLKALQVACIQRGVRILSGVAAEEFHIRGERLDAVDTSIGRLEAAQYCLTAGSWTGVLARRLGVTLRIKPIRGQMVLFSCDRPPLQRIINEGIRYVVPRPDGRVLVGSTEENVGFDRRTTGAGVAELLEFAFSLVPSLREAEIERTWAGLRPSTTDGRPYVGHVPGLRNVFVAAGHFRSGLQRSPATAVVMRQLICDEPPEINLDCFRLDRE